VDRGEQFLLVLVVAVDNHDHREDFLTADAERCETLKRAYSRQPDSSKGRSRSTLAMIAAPKKTLIRPCTPRGRLRLFGIGRPGRCPTQQEVVLLSGLLRFARTRIIDLD
jgi:hypothetical protein